MAPPKKIVGNPGTDPEAAPPREASRPPDPEPAELVGRLAEEGGHFYVRAGSLRLRLDDESVSRLRQTSDRARRPSALRVTVPAEFTRAIEAARRHRHELLTEPDVIAVRAGFKFVDGKITMVPCVVVAVRGEGKLAHIPAALDGVPTQTAPADPYEILQRLGPESAPALVPIATLVDGVQLDAAEMESAEAVPTITYEPPEGGDLSPVTGAMSITCHVSPDAGWGVLRPFLLGAERKLRLGMYDFTAPHIYSTARTLLRDSSVSWKQTLGPKESLPGDDDVDSTKAGDLPEVKVVQGLKRVGGKRFASVFARVGKGQTFASAYHIKVAVRDDEAVWLSSGNWQSSNQPSEDFLAEDADLKGIPRYNREWHLVIENAALAKKFQCYLEHDFETAEAAPETGMLETAGPPLLVPAADILDEERAAANLEVFAPKRFVFSAKDPLTVQPILTPDNYLEVVLDLLRQRPRRRLYFQNQSLNPILKPTAEFAELMQILADYSNDTSLDVRFIFRNIGPIRKKLESLQLAGFNMSRIRMQAGCHTKGIVIDSETVLLGSHNCTNQGVQVNRDASVLIRHDGIARYYERVFLHDWEKLARQTIREEATPIPMIAGGLETGTLDGTVYAQVPWATYVED